VAVVGCLRVSVVGGYQLLVGAGVRHLSAGGCCRAVAVTGCWLLPVVVRYRRLAVICCLRLSVVGCYQPLIVICC